jgi:hypothetical protein
VTLSTRHSSSKLSAAFLVKRVRDVKNEPGGKHAVTKRQNKAKKAENKNASAGLAKLRAEGYEREFARAGRAAALGRSDARTGAFAGLNTARP